MPICECLSGDLRLFAVCFCAWLMCVWGLSFFSFFLFLVCLKGKCALPVWRRCVFVDFSKALPISKLAVSDDSEAPRPQTAFPILLAHPCDCPCRGYPPSIPGLVILSHPPPSINIGLEYTSVLQNSAKVLFRSLL